MEKYGMVSIIIPALNEENFLSGCIKSLEKQNYEGDFEIVVVDNRSNDNTVRIAEGSGVKIVHCQKRGVFYARRAGVKAADGGIIIQADADTIYPEDWLSKIMADFSDHPDAVAVAGIFIYRDPPFWAYIEYFLRKTVNVATVLMFKRPFFVSGANFAFKKEPFLEVGGYNKDSFSFDQYGIASALADKGEIVYDKNIYALTSSRRVQKFVFIIFLEVIRNLIIVTAYFSKSLILSVARYIKGLFSGKGAVKFSPADASRRNFRL